MIGIGSSCGACKFLRRRCNENCVFAPHFSYDEAASTFAAVHKVFGASNVSKLLSNLPEHNRAEAAITISYEALARMNNPIYGCVSHIFALQQQVISLREEIETLENHMASQLVNDRNHLSNYGLHYSPISMLKVSSQENHEMLTRMGTSQIDFENFIISQNGENLVNQVNFHPSQNYKIEEQISLEIFCLDPLERVQEETREKSGYMRFPSRLGLIDEHI